MTERYVPPTKIFVVDYEVEDGPFIGKTELRARIWADTAEAAWATILKQQEHRYTSMRLIKAEEKEAPPQASLSQD